MNEPHDTISDVEDALQSLQVLAQSLAPEPYLAKEVQRLEGRLRQLELLLQVFQCRA